MTKISTIKNDKGGTQKTRRITEGGGSQTVTTEAPMPVTQPGAPSPMEQGKATKG